jgi:hypothetical protein
MTDAATAVELGQVYARDGVAILHTLQVLASREWSSAPPCLWVMRGGWDGSATAWSTAAPTPSPISFYCAEKVCDKLIAKFDPKKPTIVPGREPFPADNGQFRRQFFLLALSSWLMRTFNVFSRFFPRSVVLHSAGSSLYMRSISSCRFFAHLASAHAPLGLLSRRVPINASMYLSITSRHSLSVFCSAPAGTVEIVVASMTANINIVRISLGPLQIRSRRHRVACLYKQESSDFAISDGASGNSSSLSG